ncbi:MAG: T9SS type A sorting domain-containing protein [Bacteroidota bacterium]
MKHIYKFLIGALLLFISSQQVIGQDIVDLPASNPYIVDAIAGDTTGTGERNNPDRIYRLERGGSYLIDKAFVVNYPLHLIATDGDGRLPMIASGKDAEGANIRPTIQFTSDNETHTIENILFTGVDLDRKHNGEEWFSGLTFLGDSSSISIQGCVFNYFTSGGVNVGGKGNSVYLRDCIWRNHIDNDHPFSGQQITLGLQLDTLVVTNCTQFNGNSYWLLHETVSNYTLIEHNTIFATMINGLFMPYHTMANIRSNLFYAYSSYGDTELSRTNKWYEGDQEPLGTLSIRKVPTRVMTQAGLTEEERIINVTNNAYYWPQAIKDYWAAYDTVTGPVWMNDRTIAMFDDNVEGRSYPYLHRENNIEADPKFTDTAMEEFIIGELAAMCTEMRETSTSGWGIYTGDRNYDVHLGDDALTGIQWPLPEDLAYSDAVLLTAGHDGLPVGDLNWFPDKRAEYVEDPIEPVSVEKDNSAEMPTVYELSQNYPNPFNPSTVINFSIPTSGVTTLKVFNVLGQEVAELVNNELAAGNYKYEFDASQLTSGVYFYQMQSNQYSEVRKMMLLK